MFPLSPLTGGRSVSLNMSGGTANRSSGPGANISLTMNTDGTAPVAGSVFSTVTYLWCTPATLGIGSSYWVKYTETITLNNGSGGGSTTGSTGILALTTPRVYQVFSDVLTNTITVSLQIDLYADSGGTQLVSTRTITLTANRT